MNNCDVPMYLAMCRLWREIPPAATQLRRIAAFIGIKVDTRASDAVQTSERSTPAATASTFEDFVGAAAQAGIPAFPGRPNDPMLDLIDLPIPTTPAH